MARKGSGELSPPKRWAAAVFFGWGIVLVLLYVYGPAADGRADILRIIGGGLIGVSVFLFAGINMPAMDWSAILVRVLTALLKESDAAKGGER